MKQNSKKHNFFLCLYSHSTQYSSKYSSNIKNSFNSEAHALNTISQQLHHMGGACCLHDRDVQKLTWNMLCPFLTSPGEGRPQHYITILLKSSKSKHQVVHEQKLKDPLSSTCQVSVERIVLDLKSEAVWVLIPLG